jgi:hypothetical protein
MTAGLTAKPARPAAPTRTVPVVLLAWFVAALVFGPALLGLPFPGGQLAIIALVVVASIGLGNWFSRLSWRALIGMHAIRVVGLAFVILGTRGLLAPAFASRAGWGDIVAALGAIGLALASARPKWLVHLWNAFGALDLIVAVGTATLAFVSGSQPGVDLLRHLPLNLVPTFFVPLLMASHVAIFRRLRAS